MASIHTFFSAKLRKHPVNAIPLNPLSHTQRFDDTILRHRWSCFSPALAAIHVAPRSNHARWRFVVESQREETIYRQLSGYYYFVVQPAERRPWHARQELAGCNLVVAREVWPNEIRCIGDCSRSWAEELIHARRRGTISVAHAPSLSHSPPPQSYRRPRRVGSMRFSKSRAIRCKTGLLRFVWWVYLFVRCHMPAMRPPLCACTVHEEPMDPLFFLRFNTPITHRLFRDLSSQSHLFASPFSLSLSLSLATRSRVFMRAYSCCSASIST